MWEFLFDTVIGTWYDWVVRNVPAPVQWGCVAVLFALIVALLWVLLA